MSTGHSTVSTEYREIPSRPGFRFGDDASIQTAWTMGVTPKIGTEWRTIRPSPRPTGYSWVYLGSRERSNLVRLDEIICEAFCGPRPVGMECLHRDGQRENCSAGNLFWGIAPENVRDPDVEYRTIPQCEGYDFGADGSCWSYWGTGNDQPGDVPRRMNSVPLHRGHRQVTVRWNGELKGKGVHYLIATAFYGPCPDGLECCHEDGDPTNNVVTNLRWGTRASNARDSIRHGTMCRGEAKASAKLTEEDVLKAREDYACGASINRLAALHGISWPSMVNAIDGTTWSRLPNSQPLREGYAHKLTDEEIVETRRRYAAGESTAKLAKEFGLTIPLMVRAITGIVGNELPGAVAIRPPRMLTEEQKVEMQQLYASQPIALKALAERFGTSIPTVRKILFGK